jgi:thiol-disulfide isomerase/thioredoxin
MKKLSLFIVAVIFFCFGIVTPGCSKNVSGAAPEVSAKTWINTDSFKLADHHDKVVIVEFWATWCPPCRTSIPHLKSLYNEYKDKGVMIVSLTQESADVVNEFNKKAGMNWIIGAESSSGADYGVRGIPAAFIVVDGKIVWNGHPMGGLDEELQKVVAARGGVSTASTTAVKDQKLAPAPSQVVPEKADEEQPPIIPPGDPSPATENANDEQDAAASSAEVADESASDSVVTETSDEVAPANEGESLGEP